MFPPAWRATKSATYFFSNFVFCRLNRTHPFCNKSTLSILYSRSLLFQVLQTNPSSKAGIQDTDPGVFIRIAFIHHVGS